VFPNATHCLCTYHISNNLKMHFKTETQLVKDAFHAAARAYTVEEFDRYMSEIRKLDPSVVTFLVKLGVHKWARAHCRSNRYFTMTSNAAETINSAIRSLRELPITTLLEALRDMQQRWSAANRDEAKSTFTALAKKPHSMLENNYKIATRFY
ncbi:MuDR family transposase, partial [Striga hermonthica]